MKKQLKYLVIHCTATPAGRKVTPNDIRHWHTSTIAHGGNGWKQVGYSNLILLDGNNVTMVDDNGDDWVDVNEITNGVAGINSVSKHICYVGGLDYLGKKPADTRTDLQKKTLETFVKDFVKKHSAILVAGHNQFAAKACPSFDVPQWLKEIGIPDKNIYKKAS